MYFRIPIWPYAKLIATCWLVLPYFSGAAYVYEHYVRPIYVNPQTINIWYVPRKKDTFGKRDDILTAAEKYIQENGTDAFENLINRVFPSIEPSCSVIMLCFCVPLVLTVSWLCRLINPEGVAVIIQRMMRLIKRNHVISVFRGCTCYLYFCFTLSVGILLTFFFNPLPSYYYPVASLGLVVYALYNGYDTHGICNVSSTAEIR